MKKLYFPNIGHHLRLRHIKMQNKDNISEERLKSYPTWRKNPAKKSDCQNYDKFSKYDKELLSQKEGESIIINFNEDVNNHHTNHQYMSTPQKRQPVKENQIMELEKKLKRTEANLHRLCSEISSDETFKQLTEKGVSISETGLSSIIRRYEEEGKTHLMRLPISVQRKYETYCSRISPNESRENLYGSSSQEVVGRLSLKSPRSPSPAPFEEGIYSVLEDVPTARRNPHNHLVSSSTLSTASDDTEDGHVDSVRPSESSASMSVRSFQIHPVVRKKRKSGYRTKRTKASSNAMREARASINGMLLRYCDDQELTEKMTNGILQEYSTGRSMKNIITGARNQDKIASRGLLLCVTDMQKIRKEMDVVRKATRALTKPVVEKEENACSHQQGEMQLMEYVQGNPYAVQDDEISKVNMLQQAKTDLLDIFGKSSLDPKFLKKLAEPPRWNT